MDMSKNQKNDDVLTLFVSEDVVIMPVTVYQ
jgi:hypothetical protein